ncbi:MAG TPA: FAD-dependent oxidoreductase [Pirellulales bacterium]|jgi:pyruvate/2-oxoglutarate dehydrogenase complex dihydrolipoamide dehydrogenase (E3) component
MAIEHYQNVMIGSGEAGKFLAWTLARHGEKSLVIERWLMGGACPNVACLPSKNVIHSAKVAALANHAATFGVNVGLVKIDMPAVIAHKQRMIDGLMEIHHKNFHDSGAELQMGHARLLDRSTVEIALPEGGTRVVTAERIFLAVGTRATLPEVPGLADARPMTHVEALQLDHLPEHLVIIGGGYVGLEFAQALRRFGSSVTILQHGRQLLEREDPEFSAAVLQIMQDEGIEVLLDTNIEKVTGRSGECVQLTVTSPALRTIVATDLLIATGRTPNTDRLGTEKAGVRLDARGYIQVNERLETGVPGIWALGECAGSPQFTHVSYDDYRIVRDNLAGGHRTTRNRIIPYCLFTDPELAHVGLSEREAKAQGLTYRLLRMPMAAVLRTFTHGDQRGMVKVLIGQDDRILGFTALGVEANEMAAAVQVAMLGKLPYTVLREGIFPHPTTAEALMMLFAGQPSPPDAA